MSSVPAVPAPDEKSVFLNVPFDSRYCPLFLALIAGLTALGRKPRCVLEIADGGPDRLQRIVELMAGCGASVHDLSRVSLSSGGGFRVPRFNMPFELGLACMLKRHDPGHRIYLLEERSHRLQVSLSDLSGHDPHIHHGTQTGVLACALACFDRPGGAPALSTLRRLTRRLSRPIRDLQREHRRNDPFHASIFREAVTAAGGLARAEGLLGS